MARPLIQPRDCERKFLIEELFFSITDRAGVILSGNEVFARIAAYGSPQELLGKPHNIIRHPDMPRAVFKLLWDTILEGHPIAAYVKNLAKDGCYYWVLAMVMPIGDKFISVRCKPTTEIRGVVEGVYKTMLEIEGAAMIPKERDPAMARSAEFLMEQLDGLGFNTYQEFMGVVISSEVISRLRQVPTIAEYDVDANVTDQQRGLRKIQVALRLLLRRAEEFSKLIEHLNEKSTFLQGLANRLRIIALNAIVSSHHLDESGQCLGVVTQELAAASAHGSSSIAELNHTIAEVVHLLRTAVVELGAASLLTDMAVNFLDEDSQQHDAAVHKIYHTREDDEAMTQGAARERVSELLACLGQLSLPVEKLAVLSDELRQVLLELSATRSVGSIEVARLNRASNFDDLFAEITERLTEARAELAEFQRALEALQEDIGTFASQSTRLKDSLTALEAAA